MIVRHLFPFLLRCCIFSNICDIADAFFSVRYNGSSSSSQTKMFHRRPQPPVSPKIRAKRKQTRRAKTMSFSASAEDEAESENGPRANLLDLLSTCVDAAERGCAAIRRVQEERERRDRAGAPSALAVDYKIDGDPRSAVTAADVSSQAAIVDALTREWPRLTIVGEEDVVAREERSTLEGGEGCLRKDLCYKDDDAAASGVAGKEAALDRIAVFVDPLDGTREFVEGRLENVQILIGITVDGVAVGGAVGLPFPPRRAEEKDRCPASSSVVVYGLVGAGRLGVRGDEGSTAENAAPVRSEGTLLLAAGDTNDRVLADAYRAVSDASPGGCVRVLMGGTGTKILAVAEGRADVAVMNFKSSRWDTCAAEGLLRTVGGRLTDLLGEPLVHRPDIVPPATSYLNDLGAVASAAHAAQVHAGACEAMRRNPAALEKLVGVWGLTEEEAREADAEGVSRVMGQRRKIQTQGLPCVSTPLA
uniref:3'(2'),5'-bisphosphate nucleotidase n=1 Tax=Corethron hystrix TaxID=216773 RepID=A0A6U5M0X7_9STRA|mmetsp:Transcript_7983/g.17331  ORF Transcript_7983/g.17331 Transcript_7983/m.17331 type:complete len:476 (+) Transcript_7983:345-1772(+)